MKSYRLKANGRRHVILFACLEFMSMTNASFRKEELMAQKMELFKVRHSERGLGSL